VPHCVAGNEWCSCMTRQPPAILRKPIVNRNSSGSRLPFGPMSTHLPMAVAKATSGPSPDCRGSCDKGICHFSNLNSPPFGGPEFQTNLIMPEPLCVSEPQTPTMISHSPHGNKRDCHGCGQFPDRNGTLYRSAAGLLCFAARSGAGRGPAQERTIGSFADHPMDALEGRAWPLQTSRRRILSVAKQGLAVEGTGRITHWH
jgi:hypothetical protein